MSETSGQALVVGASRGIGLGLARELLARHWRVVATVRQPSEALNALGSESGGRLRVETVDINRPEQVQDLHRHLQGTRFDLLFLNAGVLGAAARTISEVSHEEFVHALTTNAFSPVRFADNAIDLLNSGATIAFMTSQLGSITNNRSGGYEMYRASKAALNMLCAASSPGCRTNTSPFCCCIRAGFAPIWEAQTPISTCLPARAGCST